MTNGFCELNEQEMMGIDCGINVANIIGGCCLATLGVVVGLTVPGGQLVGAGMIYIGNDYVNRGFAA